MTDCDGCRAGSEELLQRLIDMGANVNAAATGGVTPLHVAAEVGLKSVVQILLKVGKEIFQYLSLKPYLS